MDQPYAKFAIGAWRYSEKSTSDSWGNGIDPTANNGLYLLVEKEIYRDADEPEQGIAVFGRYGVADGTVNQLDSYFGAGIVYTGLIPGRDEDQVGLAVAVANNGREYKNGGTPVDDRETAWELSYRAQITPWLAIQPDIQYILDPGMDPLLDDAMVFSLRFELEF
jgi:porin